MGVGGQETPAQSVQKDDIGSREKIAFCSKIWQEYFREDTKRCLLPM